MSRSSTRPLQPRGSTPGGAAIAVVGMACRYPDADSPQALWENVLAQRQSFRRMPRERLDLDDHYSDDRGAPDRTYATMAAVLEGYAFDRVAHRVAGSTYRSADLAHWLALDVATDALADAGLPAGDGLPRDTTGVLIGNSLTGEFSRAATLRVRWPYVKRVVGAALAGGGWSDEDVSSFLRRLEVSYKAPFAPVGDETLAGGLSNTIAGRICNAFDFKGGGYTVDGACSSSLLAIANACSALTVGDLDAAIVGGVDLSLDPFEIVGFAKVGALAPDRMRVYDARSAGFWPGEGSGMLVLMRLADAIATGRRVLGIIRGWGISSDGTGGITRPEVAGQRLAIARAYARAGYGIDTLGYVEGHGTGTTVGDATEIDVLGGALREAGAGRRVALGSIKANIGHTKAAAGAAGFLRALLAVGHGIVPPHAGTRTPHPSLEAGDAPLRLPREPEGWDAASRRAGVSSMGFGGINVHITLEADGSDAPRGRRLAPRTARLARTPQDVELFGITAPTREALGRRLESLRSQCETLAFSELPDLAATLAREAARGPHRVALIADSPAELARRIDDSLARLSMDGPVVDGSGGLFIGSGPAPRIGFLFPGQGSPSRPDGGSVRRRFERAAALYERVGRDGLFPAVEDPTDTALAQPAILAATLVTLEVLDAVGVRARAALGHSLGEIAALAWGGALSHEGALRLSAARGRAMASVPGPAGAMASIAASPEDVAAWLAELDLAAGATGDATAPGAVPDRGGAVGHGVVIAGYNGPARTVVSGPSEAVDAFVERVTARGATATRLRVSHAFHSGLMAPASTGLAAAIAAESWRPCSRVVVSTVTGDRVPERADVGDLLRRQLTEPVRFSDALSVLARDVDLLIEVGPGTSLATLAAAQVSTPVVATDGCGDSLRGLLGAIGAAWALGASVDLESLFGDRAVRPFDGHRPHAFLANPCESAPRPGAPDGSPVTPSHAGTLPAPAIPAAASPPGHTGGGGATLDERVDDARDEGLPDESGTGPASALDVVRTLVATRAELPLESIGEDDHVLDDLRLNSIVVGEIVTNAARRLGLDAPTAPAEFADSTVGEIAAALAALLEDGPRGRDRSLGLAPDDEIPEGVSTWFRTFATEWVEAPAPASAPLPDVRWEVLGDPTDGLVAELTARLGEAGSGDAEAPGGTLVVLPARVSDDDVVAAVDAAGAHLGRGGTHFVLVQRADTLASLARTLHLEDRRVTTRIVTVPDGSPRSARAILAEIAGDGQIVEARYESDGRRVVPVLGHVPIGRDGASADGSGTVEPAAGLGADDVLLVTGGGKGIAAECALAIAAKTRTALLLIGRSDPAHDPVLAGNLARIAGAGCRAHYARADVTDPAAVANAVAEGARVLGPITGVLHGAGRNEPSRIRMLDRDRVLATLAPKTRGLEHVLASVDPSSLRLLVTFGSIIATAGLAGEADYAIANERLAAMTAAFGHANPTCRCVCLGWSIWSGTGMGERLGRVETLARQGVVAITPDAGVDVLGRILRAPALPTHLVVTGRFGDPPTVRTEPGELPLRRFLERPRVHVPGVELVADATVDPAHDPYLDDHVLDGVRVFPAVMGLEAMAQVAMALARRDDPPAFHDVRFDRAVTIPETGATLRIAALADVDGAHPGAGVIRVVVRSSETSYAVDHFTARCRFTDAPPPDVDPIANGRPARFDLGDRLYREILFQRGRFARAGGYDDVQARRCVGRLTAAPPVGWFGAFLPQALVLGDPGRRDAMLHGIQVSVPHRRLLPVSATEIVFRPCGGAAEPGAPRSASDAAVFRAVETAHRGADYTYDVDAGEERGVVVECWRGLVFRAVGPIPLPETWPRPLLGSYLERRIAETWPDRVSHVAVDRSGTSTEDILRAAIAASTHVHRRPDGKPVLSNGTPVAISTHGPLALAVVAADPAPVGCDVEAVVPRDRDAWRALVGDRGCEVAELVSMRVPEPFDAAATRVWCIKESVRKAGGTWNEVLSVTSVDDAAWVRFRAGSFQVATLRVVLEPDPDLDAGGTGCGGPMIVAVLVEERGSEAAREGV